MNAFIDAHRGVYGVEPICKILQIAPSTYYRHAARQADAHPRSARTQRDQQNGARKVWRQLRREGMAVARCIVERLMRRLDLKGVRRGKSIKTTVSNRKNPSRLDRVHRPFTADRPNALWVADFTYVSTGQGFIYVAFVIDVFARYIVGWKTSRAAGTDFVLAALEQALYARRPFQPLIHHSDRGVQYVSIRYTERLAKAGIESSVGRVGDSYDNALAETINGLYKTEVIHRQSWKSLEAVEWTTLTWVHWFNHRRLLEPMGYQPPAEVEAVYYEQLYQSAMTV
jgi:transposase InsO family protein